jgi:RNA polymerase sigma-70 factor (ECF subfamily)
MVRSRSENTRAEMAKALGMTENAAAVALHRLRKRFQAVFRAQVAATVGSEAEVEDEIIHLRQLFLKG